MLLLSPILIKIQTKQKCKTFLEMIFMTDMKLRKLVLAALFAALCTVMTMVIQVPSPMQGYVNLGDCAVLLSAWVLGPWYGGAAAGLGSMLADLLSYPHYAPGTLVIKFTMAVAAAYIFEAMRERSGKLAAQLIGGAGQLLHLGLIFLGDLPNVGDHILSVKAAEHPRSEICAHSILRYTRGICRNAAENRISFSSTIAQTWLYDKREML